MRGAVHIIGAGLSGLAAAVVLADTGCPVFVHEAAAYAGGRCRSFHDTQVETTIDNGNHLVLSGNRATLTYLDRIGGRHAVTESKQAEFPFIDLATGERWSLRLSDGRIPWWVLDPRRRVPGSQAADYAAIIRLLLAKPGERVSDVLRCEGLLYERLWRPLLLAALNIDPKEADAGLAARLLWETFGSGGAACRPVIAKGGLSEAFVNPALRCLRERGVEVHYARRLQRLVISQNRVAGLIFGDEVMLLDADDQVILAVPPKVAGSLAPSLRTPDESRGIVNVHFRIKSPRSMPAMVGVVNGVSDWVFAYPDRLSVTVSGTELAHLDRQEIAHRVWCEVSYITGLYMTGLSDAPPLWQVIREKRATFATTPQEVRQRSGSRTQLNNLFVAGDWTDTGLPACIEGAIRSGSKVAADVVNQQAAI